MNYKVFIGYSSEDNDKAQYIHDCLGSIVQLLPYKAELYQAYGEDFKQRIQRQLEESYFMVVLLTNSGKNSQWVNQEIGYAYALKKRPRLLPAQRDLPHIIPISESQLRLKGFITKDTMDILFLNNFPNFELIVANIILHIRQYIPRGIEEGFLRLRVTCSNCFDKKGFPYEYDNALVPDVESIQKIVQSGEPIVEYTCPKCKTKNLVDARTFLPLKLAER